uniref:TransThyretin-Related family domain n=1 Tax=Caenorhabditis tropicalis TaxID=1561998 RepID=A0A1I7UIF4_9PELO
MRASVLFFYFLCLALNASATEYHFDFYLDLKCNLENREDFGVNIQFFDYDVVLNGPDQITDQYINTFPIGKRSFFKVIGSISGDEWLSNYFDVRMTLYHNCNNKKDESLVEVTLEPLFEISNDKLDKYYLYEMALDITNLEGHSTYKGQLVES